MHEYLNDIKKWLFGFVLERSVAQSCRCGSVFLFDRQLEKHKESCAFVKWNAFKRSVL